MEEFNLISKKEQPFGREISGIVTNGTILFQFLFMNFYLEVSNLLLMIIIRSSTLNFSLFVSSPVGSAVTRVSIGDEVAGKEKVF